jgi:hypothetical protein
VETAAITVLPHILEQPVDPVGAEGATVQAEVLPVEQERLMKDMLAAQLNRIMQLLEVAAGQKLELVL